MDKDKLAGLIKDIINEEIARLISFCKTQPPAAHIAAMQSINVKCDPPEEWGELVYNGELCKMVRADPALSDFRCDACYACCIKDVTQNAVITINGECNIGRDALAAAVASLKAALMFRLPRRTERDVMNIELLSTSVALDNIPAALQKVVLLQRVNISGIGAVNAIKQNIAMDLLFRSTVSATTKTAIDTYIKEFLAYVLPSTNANLPAPTMSPALVDLIPNSITIAANKADEDARLIQSAGSSSGGSNSNNSIDNPVSDNIIKDSEVARDNIIKDNDNIKDSNTKKEIDTTDSDADKSKSNKSNDTDINSDEVEEPKNTDKLSPGAIAGIVIAILAFIISVVIAFRSKSRRKTNNIFSDNIIKQ